LKIDLSDMKLVKDLMLLIRRIYKHEQTPPILRTYIKFEMNKYLGTHYDIKGFLEGDEE
jgi:hypothetical protein